MDNQKKSIEKLLINAVKNVTSNTYFLSYYIPTQNSVTDSDLKTKVKSIVLGSMRAHTRLHRMSQAHAKIIEALEEEVSSIAQPGRGLGIFIKCKPNRLERAVNVDDTSLQIDVVVLAKRPVQESTIGKTFNLDQLIWITNQSIDVAVLNIDSNEAKLYLHEDDRLEPITTIVNKYQPSRTDKKLAVRSPNKSYTTYYAPGSEKLQAGKEEIQKAFIGDVEQTLIKECSQGIDQILLYYSFPVAEAATQMLTNVKKLLPQIKVYGAILNINSEERLLKEVAQKINKDQDRLANELVELASELDHIYAKGWAQVTKAARRQKIEILFLKPNLKKIGYLLDNELPYSYAVKGSHHVHNLTPWLVKSVVEAGGRIVLVKKSSIMPNYDVTAQLRY